MPAGAFGCKSRGDIIADRDLYAGPDGFLCSPEEKFGRLSADVFLTAVGTNVSGNVFDH
jgi:hypothetical protein